ncbi:MAG: acetylglutamate kinase [Candidatus Eisenbacteria bacterium]|uniref:Acetylglutamate kinase n=1 Tax=Eiseniibacteriota bacterium TaxID=2212470 RepID=A0A933WA23_UNCEI|nr:acetylglutamate kinase [Candidatus Eisenbacteria bacterium]
MNPGRGTLPVRPVVIKLGGRALEAPGAPAEFAAALAALAHPAVVVHGGGAEVTAWCGRLGITSRFEGGLRVTDPATLEVATAVLAGLANKRLVAALRAAGVDAVGLAALDGGTLRVRRHAQSATLGEVGEVAGVDASLLNALLAQGRTPVLASIAATDAGELLNVNADDAASALAAAVHASDLTLLSDTPGLKLDGEVVSEIAADEFEATLAHPQVEGGMRPKLAGAAAAVRAGVARAHIAAWRGPETLTTLLLERSHGTLLHAGAASGSATEVTHG